MSQLPKGTSAARSFVDTVAINGAMASLIAWAPPLGWPVIKDIIQLIIQRVLIDPTLDDATALAYAAKFLLDRTQFDKRFIELAMLDKQNASPDEIEKELNDAQDAMDRFIRRGPTT